MSNKIHDPVYYGDYLQLNKLLDSQHPKSKEINNEAHDETLFIIVHQVYELWFKQIIHELKSITTMFSGTTVEERDLTTVVARLERITKIQGLLVDQLSVMETMTPMDFLEFRDLLVPASGFQSVQFREIEVLMGLRTHKRKEVDRDFFLGRLSEEDKKRILEIEKSPSLLELAEGWLERIPFTKNPKFDFWAEYETQVEKILDADEKIIHENQATLDSRSMAIQIENLNSTRETFASLLNDEKHNQLIKLGRRTLSRKATLNALFILLYRDEPILHLPYKFLTALMDIDELFTTWRYRHAIMAQRMLGTKIGTGGSSGHQYLKMAAENNRVYLDLFNLSTFLIPRSMLPTLPEDIRRNLGFHFNE
ncbi:tryptophan 2,3-dioxygenase [Halobacteriovorax marinus]|uniref:Tryptophan 2,3-dioxygenase n=1 Tax=Halobacteriovorax marinus TaxID=97084 RepID=A0A1Y5F7Q4_9BACT|nr:tryptophan 2,3-dioxygenase [Halobacteriovorax marinus]